MDTDSTERSDFIAVPSEIHQWDINTLTLWVSPVVGFVDVGEAAVDLHVRPWPEERPRLQTLVARGVPDLKDRSQNDYGTDLAGGKEKWLNMI